MINRSVTELESDLASIDLEIKALSTRLGRTYYTETRRDSLRRDRQRVVGLIEHPYRGLHLVPKQDDDPINQIPSGKSTFKAVDLRPHSIRSDIWGNGK